MSEKLKKQVSDGLRRDSTKHPGHNHDFCGGITRT